MNRDDIKQAAVKMVEEFGLINLSRAGLCREVGIPEGSFQHFMGCTFTGFIQELGRMGITDPWASVTKARTNPELRKTSILKTALILSGEKGYRDFKISELAEAAGVSRNTIFKYFKTVKELRGTVLRLAISERNLPVIAQGIVSNDTIAALAPDELKRAALAAW